MRFLVFLLLCILPAQVWASPPVPSKKSEALNFDRKIDDQKADKKALKKKAESVSQEMAKTQDQLVKVAADIQDNETALSGLTKRIDTLSKDKAQKEKNLEKDQAQISQLILALERIRRRPPEAMIINPDTPYKTAQSAMLMQNILPKIDEKAKSLKAEMEELASLRADLDAQKDKLSERQANLEKRQAELSGLLDKRKKLFASTQSDLKHREAEIRKISKQARNLKDLVSRLDEERTRAQNRSLKQNAFLTRPVANPKDIKPGTARLPIAGIIKTAYNQPDNFGAPSQGVDIEGRGGALVVAPMGGVVKFTGPFKNYGQIVIIEHRGEYHSLVAGLEKIDTVVGQSLDAGEPLGRLHHSRSGGKPVLYYELRHKGKPINPGRKISALR